MTVQKRTAGGVVHGDQPDHERAYVALRRLKWGDAWLEPGDEIPRELGRDYRGLVRRGDVAPFIPSQKGDRS